MKKTKNNKLYFGDNLDFIRNLDYFPSESIDLVYLDPPFNSARNYNLLFKEVNGMPSSAQVMAFEDTWNWDESAARALHTLNSNERGVPNQLTLLVNAFEEFLSHSPMFAYLVQMSVRLVELHRLLKPSGTLFLHCDPTSSHYLKLVLDALFGVKMFRNEIIWHYRRWTAASKRLQRMHDVILFYAKSEQATINQLMVLPTAGQMKKHERGWDRNTVLIKGKREPQLIVYDQEKVDSAVDSGKLNLSDYSRVVVPKSEMTTAPDVWTIDFINSQAKERLGYPTQKPLELLDRIVRTASSPGSVILDPFCGCGTTIDAVESINQENPGVEPRQWIGIDITHLAIDLIKSRLATRFGLSQRDYEVVGEPTTLDEARALAAENRYQFQYWALGLIGARPWGADMKKGRDRGIDGWRLFLHGSERTFNKCLVQVKSGKVNPSHVRDLKGTMEREKAEMSVFISLEPYTNEMKSEALSAGYYHSDVMNRDYQRIQLLTVEQLLADPDCFKIPPGGEYQSAPKFTKPEKTEGLFES